MQRIFHKEAPPTLTVSAVRNDYQKKRAHFDQLTDECARSGTSSNPRVLFNHLCKHIVGSQQRWDMVSKIVNQLDESGILWTGDAQAIGGSLKKLGLRFHSSRGQWLYQARQDLYLDQTAPAILSLVSTLRQKSEEDPRLARATLTERQPAAGIPHIKGIGMKWASHFLRDLGLSRNELAILDSRVLGALGELGMANLPRPEALTNKYSEVECRLKVWARDNVPEIPLDHLDWVLWELMGEKAHTQWP